MKLLRLFTGGILIFCFIFTVFVGKNKISEQEIEDVPKEYKGVLTLWQIDGFEGGSGSRKQFLLKVARGFENSNSGVLVMVSSQTIEGAIENVKQGKFPDIISYSNGTEILSVLSEMRLNRTVSACKIADKIYGTVWCRSGYVLISNPLLTEEVYPKSQIEKLIVSQGEYTQPLLALSLENIKVGELEVKTPMEAYISFVSGKSPYFLGTQRDLVRLNNRGMNYNAYPLKEFNDLYQYVSVTSEDQLKKLYSEKFIEYLVSDNVQKELNQIKMYSEFISVDYEEENYKNMQAVKGVKSLSAYTSQAQLKELQRISMLNLAGENDYINKIKNVLI